jgi:hypothetical protein
VIHGDICRVRSRSRSLSTVFEMAGDAIDMENYPLRKDHHEEDVEFEFINHIMDLREGEEKYKTLH